MECSRGVGLVLAVAVVMVLGQGNLQGVAGQVTSECTAAAQSLLPCEPYVQNGGTDPAVSTPPPACCTPLTDVLASSPDCFCQLALQLGTALNLTRATQLSFYCKIATVPSSVAACLQGAQPLAAPPLATIPSPPPLATIPSPPPPLATIPSPPPTLPPSDTMTPPTLAPTPALATILSPPPTSPPSNTMAPPAPAPATVLSPPPTSPPSNTMAPPAPAPATVLSPPPTSPPSTQPPTPATTILSPPPTNSPSKTLAPSNKVPSPAPQIGDGNSLSPLNYMFGTLLAVIYTLSVLL